MAIKIDLEHNLADLTKTFKEVEKAVPQAAKMALRRALKTMVDVSQKKVRERYRLQRKIIVKKHFIESTKLQGSTLSAMRGFEANLGILDKKISLINFVKGSKSPRKQQGVKVRQRKKVRVEVRPGRAIGLAHGFIAKGKNGNMGLFSRITKASLPIRRDSVPSLHHLFEKSEFRQPIEDATGKQLQKEFQSAFNILIDRMRTKKGA